MLVRSMTRGFLAALIICGVGWFLSQKAGKRFDKWNERNDVSFFASRVYVETTIRFLVSAFGIIGVLLALGPEMGVPCALFMIPLYFIEIIGGIYCRFQNCVHNRKAEKTDGVNSVTKPESNL